MPARSLVDPLPFLSVFPRGILICRSLFLRAPSLHTPLTSFDARISYQGLGPRHDLTTLASTGRFEEATLALLHDLTGTCARHSGVAIGSHTYRFGPSAGVLSLSTVYSAIGLAGLLHPTAMFRTTTVQGLLSPCSSAPSSVRLAPLLFDSCVLTGCPAATRPNLRYEAFVHTKPRCTNKSGELRPCPLPSSVSCSSRCSVPRWPSRLTRSVPLLTFAVENPASGSLDIVAFSVFTSASPTLCLQKCRPARAFRPSDSGLSRAFPR